MAVLVVVVVFVLVAATVLFFAMRGAPQSVASRARARSRKTRWSSVIAFIVTIGVLGVAVPGVVIAMVVNRDSIPEDNVAKLTDNEKRGRELFGESCRLCHTLSAAGASASVGPNLDVLRPTKGLVLDAIKNGRARGNGQMAANLYTGQDAVDVAEFVAVAVGQTK
jgi:mono/diheme cytochrome c family protein